MPQANSVRQSPRPTLLCLEVHGRVLLQTWSAEAQPVKSLHHGDSSPTLKTPYKMEVGPKRIPGDGDEGPVVLTSLDNQPISDHSKGSNSILQPIRNQELGSNASKAAPNQECLCNPRGKSASSPSPSGMKKALSIGPSLSPLFPPPLNSVSTPKSQQTDAYGGRGYNYNISSLSGGGKTPLYTQFSNSVLSSPARHDHAAFHGKDSPSNVSSLSSGNKTPSSVGSKTPSSVGIKTPSSVGSKTPSSVGSKTPLSDGGKTPSSPGGSKIPSSSGGSKTPSSVGGKTPSSPTRRQSFPEGLQHSKDLHIHDEDSSSSLTCTCPHGKSGGFTTPPPKHRAPKDDDVLLPKLSLLRDSRGFIRNDDNDDSSTTSSSRFDNHRYRRSISLGQILQTPDESSYSCGSNGYNPKGRGTSYAERSPAADAGESSGRELSDFEKENLLFLKDLDNSYHRPLTQSLSNTSLGSTYSEDSLTGDSTPRGGSPYPGRREYPRTAYSPSKNSPSKIIRSISREEPEDDLSEGEPYRDEWRRKELTGRKTSLPILANRGGNTSDSSAPSSLSSLQGAPAWWNNKQFKEPPPRKYSEHSITPSTNFMQAKMVFANRSLSTPNEYTSKIPTASSSSGSSFMQEPNWRRSRYTSANSHAITGTSAMDSLQDIDRKTPVSPENNSGLTTSLTSSTEGLSGKQRNEETKLSKLLNGLTTNSASADPETQPSVGGTNDEDSQDVSTPSGESKKPSPMAFTIELGGGGVQTEVPKKLDITASISKWAPKHRRNLSLTKVEEHKKVEERIGKPPVGRPRSGTVGATGLLQGRRAGGYHSEGYFSSDQDDEGPRRAELKSPRSPRTPELRSPQTPQRIVRSTSQDSAKGASLKKQPGKPEGRTCCKAERKPSVSEVTGRTKSEKGTKSTTKMTPEQRKQSTSANSLSSCQTYDVKLNLGCDPSKEEKDDVSEAGTYTIDKDSSSPEVEQARNDIDRVFGVSGTESDADTTPRGNAPSDVAWTPTPEADKFKSPGSLSRNSPNWIQQWAAQVAEHTKTSDSSTKALGSPRGSKPPLASLSSSQESSESRPRRKLPTPPTHHHSFGLTSPRASDMSDHESPTKGRARMDMKAGIRGSSFESHDSGGDSDLDTSTSYPINEDDDRLMKTFSSQQKTKLKLSGIDSTSRTSPISASPRKNDTMGLDSRLKLSGHFKRERSIVSDSGYDIYSGSREGEQCMQSDSSSETSEPLKDSRKTTDNNPPLKFNRAFSLRRARLGCDEPQQKSSPLEKKKIAQSASVGNVPGSRKTPLASSKSNQSTRGDGQSQKSKGDSSNDFSRGDGGRFSLRLARSGSTNTVSKSPSHSSVRKELSNGLRRAAPRSNSTLSAKEVDFQNWKRRKNYDPMKAAAEGRKKTVDKKNDKNSQSNDQSSSTGIRSPSPPGSLLRSASFHGTEGMGVGGRWPRRPNHLNTSEDDGPYSLEEEQPQPVPQCSPLRRSPTSPHQLSSSHITSPARQATLAAARARRSSYTHSDEGEGQPSSPSRKPSLDESGSEGKRSPMGSTRGVVSGRSKAKMEALDNLVISTIHSLSVKVRTTSETLLQKLKSQYDEEGDRAALLEEVLAHLSESDQTLSSGQARSTSRELAGILRNLKKIEHALEVIDRVMVGVDDDDLDEDDLDESTAHEWGESDY